MHTFLPSDLTNLKVIYGPKLAAAIREQDAARVVDIARILMAADRQSQGNYQGLIALAEAGNWQELAKIIKPASAPAPSVPE